ncbi:MAG: hypothetical protein IPM51_10420 [Sphingobacteriaceae bacterium]|nr:hypothetical protein [Sphingobacteriaceae bacterium]
MRYIFIFNLLFLLSCNTKTADRTSEIKALNKSLQIVIRENQRQINLLELKESGNAAVNPYRQLCIKLNNLILNSIDTTFEKSSSDTNVIKADIEKLNTNYVAIIDSEEKRYSHKMFLPDDAKSLREPIGRYNCPTQDSYINHYMLIQGILHRQMQNLNIISNSTSTGGIWFFQIENSGYAINGIQDKSLIKLKLYYRYPARYANYQLLELVNVTNNEGKTVPVISNEKTKNDTLKITINASQNKDYIIEAKYLVLRPTGDKREQIIKFPFTSW